MQGGADALGQERGRPSSPAAGAPPATAPGRGRGPRRGRVHLLIGAAAGLLGLLALLRPPLLVELAELRVLDWHAQLRGPRPAPPDVTVVAVDEASLRRLGHWPWPRTRTADLVARLAQGGARVIALDLLLNEADEGRARAVADGLRARYRELGLDRRPGGPAEFGVLLEQAAEAADADRALEDSVRAAGRVALPYFFVFPPASVPGLSDESLRLVNRGRVVAFAGAGAEQAIQPRTAAGLLPPLPRFHAAAAGAGHANVLPDADGALRRVESLVRLGDGLYPALALETARLALGVPRSRLRLTADPAIQLDQRTVPTDDRGLLLLSFYGPAGTFRTLSAADVLEAAGPPAVDGQVVLVGFTAHGLMDVRPTPFDHVMPGVEIQATMVANLLHGVTLYRLDAWLVLEALAVLVLAAVGPVALPRLGPLGGTAVAAVVALAAAAGAHAGYRRGAWLLVVGPLLALVVGHVTSLTYELLTEGRERRWIKQAFRLYVPPAVVEEIGRNPGQLAFGGERRVLTVLFTDLRGFTTFSEARPPEEVVATLREYLTEMSDVVFRHRGTLDKFMGDAIMAFFGAPFENADHAFQACQAALEMADRLDQLNARWREAGREPLAMGIGITTGEVLVGNFGSSQRFTYTVVGDQVNLGARLESLNKEYPTERHIIISETTYQAVRDRVATRPLGQVTVKGKHVAVEVFELVGLAPPAAAPATGGAPAAAVARTSGT